MSKTKRPSRPVTCSRPAGRSAPVRATVTPGSAPPPMSVTDPSIDPVACASASGIGRSIDAARMPAIGAVRGRRNSDVMGNLVTAGASVMAYACSAVRSGVPLADGGSSLSVNGRGGDGAWRPRARRGRTRQGPGLLGVAAGLGAWPAWSGARARARCRCLCAQPPRRKVRRPASAAGTGRTQRSGFGVALSCGTLSSITPGPRGQRTRTRPPAASACVANLLAVDEGDDARGRLFA